VEYGGNAIQIRANGENIGNGQHHDHQYRESFRVEGRGDFGQALSGDDFRPLTIQE